MPDDEWTLCDWDGRPAIWSPTESHVCVDGRIWIYVHPAEIGNDGKVMTKDAFEKTYPDLPPFPNGTPIK